MNGDALVEVSLHHMNVSIGVESNDLKGPCVGGESFAFLVCSKDLSMMSSRSPTLY